MRKGIWKTKEGTEIAIADMTDRHLRNTIRLFDSGRQYHTTILRMFEGVEEEEIPALIESKMGTGILSKLEELKTEAVRRGLK